ncbi:hypothetical protein [Aeromicrobium sp. UC242_57]|uniref:hypothetical protein n=1 Tax=Aeromicrobium sp. UC242_57 TaxID=3374624 RepID=UPI00379538C2
MTRLDERLSAGSLGELFASHRGNNSPALRFGAEEWLWDEVACESARRARWLRRRRLEAGDDRAQHIGVLLDNGPDYVFMLGGTAISGDVLVALNTSRGGEQPPSTSSTPRPES